RLEVIRLGFRSFANDQDTLARSASGPPSSEGTLWPHVLSTSHLVNTPQRKTVRQLATSNVMRVEGSSFRSNEFELVCCPQRLREFESPQDRDRSIPTDEIALLHRFPLPDAEVLK